MYIESSRNITEAFYNLAKVIKQEGTIADYGEVKLLELSPVVVNLKNPNERCLVIPGRGNNIIATLAETMWVLGGRDDIAFLLKYLPRAKDFSDDGITWRGAYGKRLLNWNGVNQLKNATNLLKNRRKTGRAVMSLFDPTTDSTLDAIDVPCNNWIQFLIRDNKLNMHVSLRANDLIWGFSGINTFEWSIIQELVASWIGIETGEYYHFIGCLVVYNRHFNRLDNILSNEIKSDIYQVHPDYKRVKVDIKEEYFEEDMIEFFEIEDQFFLALSEFNNLFRRIKSVRSNFLSHVLKILLSDYLLKNNHKDYFFQVYNEIDRDDIKIAATEYFLRKYEFDKIQIQYLKKTFNMF